MRAKIPFLKKQDIKRKHAFPIYRDNYEFFNFLLLKKRRVIKIIEVTF